MHRVSLKRWVVRSSLIFGALRVLCLAPNSARAQGPSTSGADADAVKRAREQFGQALALQTGGDWAGALALLKGVAAIKPTPQVRFNIALCEERLGRLVAALGDYELARSDSQADKGDEVRDEVDSRLEALKARVPRVVVQRAEGADSATISIDGVSLGDSVVNVPMPVDPGPHIVGATALGYRPFKQSFRVAEQQTATIQIKLELEAVKVEPLLTAEPLPTGAGVRAAGFVVGGVGVASLIGSGVMFYLRHNSIDDLDKQCGADRRSCPDSSRDAVDHGKLYTSVGDASLIAGAVAVGVGATLLIVGGRSSEHPSLALAPGAAFANVGGASLLGRF
jgi:hypothetical protein